jgi:uncharacterized protein
VIRATIDTNCLASGFVNPTPPPGQLLAYWLAGAFLLIASDHILAELAHTVEEPYFRRHLTLSRAAQHVAFLRSNALLTPLTMTVNGVATHPEDDLVLSTALSGKADYLVTGDKRFVTRVPTYQGVRLISPRNFLSLLEELSTP